MRDHETIQTPAQSAGVAQTEATVQAAVPSAPEASTPLPAPAARTDPDDVLKAWDATRLEAAGIPRLDAGGIAETLRRLLSRDTTSVTREVVAGSLLRELARYAALSGIDGLIAAVEGLRQGALATAPREQPHQSRRPTGAKVVMLPISEIVTDAGTQVRAGLDTETAKDYGEAMKRGNVFPPVVVFHDGSRYYLADGFHRVLGAAGAELTEIRADVRTGTARDAFWFALGANRANGLRLSGADMRNAIARALREFADRSHAVVAEHLGCSRQYVDRVAEQLATSSELAPPERTVGRDGKSRKAKRRPATPAPAPEPVPEAAAAPPSPVPPGGPATALVPPPDTTPNTAVAVANDGDSAPMTDVGEDGELRCPFCGSCRAAVNSLYNRKDPTFRVTCPACEAMGPCVSETQPSLWPQPLDTDAMKHEAIAVWNRAPRPPAASASAPVDPERVERFFSQLWAVLEAKPREEWPDAIEAMRRVVARAGGQAL